MRCVECGAPIEATHSEVRGVGVKLTICAACGRVADPYVECDAILVGLAALLQRLQAHRHLLHNNNNNNSGGGDGRWRQLSSVAAAVAGAVWAAPLRPGFSLAVLFAEGALLLLGFFCFRRRVASLREVSAAVLRALLLALRLSLPLVALCVVWPRPISLQIFAHATFLFTACTALRASCEPS